MFSRNYEKLINEYLAMFCGESARSQRGQLYLDDYLSVLALAQRKTAGKSYEATLYEAISAALMAGIVIGYKACKADMKEKKERCNRVEA